MLAHCGGRTMPAVFLSLSKKWGGRREKPALDSGRITPKKKHSRLPNPRKCLSDAGACVVCVGGGKFPKIYGANIPQIYSFCAKELAKTILPRIFAAKL